MCGGGGAFGRRGSGTVQKVLDGFLLRLVERRHALSPQPRRGLRGTTTSRWLADVSF